MIGIRRLAAFLAIAAFIAVASARATSMQTSARTTVIVELFTSEGCSSCPPADDLLRRLITTQPVAGVDVIALGNHVDYWDRLGWRDPFSSPLFSARQSAYDAAVFRSNGIYTPQLVVDGTLEVVGNDDAAVRRTVLKAACDRRASESERARGVGDHRGEARSRLEVRQPPHRRFRAGAGQPPYSRRRLVLAASRPVDTPWLINRRAT